MTATHSLRVNAVLQPVKKALEQMAHGVLLSVTFTDTYEKQSRRPGHCVTSQC
jgi:hypothetical protein